MIQRLLALTGIGTHHVDQAALAADQPPYQVTLVNNSGIVWEEMQVFYDMQNVAGVVPLIAPGVFPPGSGLTFYLSPCVDLKSFVWGIFFRDVTGQLLSFSAPEDGGSFDPVALAVITGHPCSVTFDVTLQP